MNFILVFTGGGLGCMARYMIGLLMQRNTSSLPLATFISNLTACIIFAIILLALKQKPSFDGILKPLLLIGFCGGLSTFSSFGYETFMMLKEQMFLYALLNILFSTTLCILVFYFFSL